MADTDQAKRDADKREAERQAEQKRLQEQQHQARQGQGGETPTPTQAESDAMRTGKERAAKEAEGRATAATDFYSNVPTPTPTQAESDAVALAMYGQQEPPEGSGMYKTPLQIPDEHQRRKQLEADRSGGYSTRSTKAE